MVPTKNRGIIIARDGEDIPNDLKEKRMQNIKKVIEATESWKGNMQATRSKKRYFFTENYQVTINVLSINSSNNE